MPFARSHPGALPARGGFCRLFPRRAPRWPETPLAALAGTMVEPMGGDAARAGTPAAGYTYLGQFIDHDLSLDRRRFRRPPGGTLDNDRTAWFDLDSIYGDGPESSDAELYAGDRFRLDDTLPDFARRDDGTALVKDGRNDSNRIVGQLHVAFLRFHNRVVDTLGTPTPHRFDAARAIVRRHYQWIVRHDFLPTIVGPPTIDDIVGPAPCDEAPERLRCLMPGAAIEIPLEFSAAAFRFGHSMVRGAYQLRADGGAVLLFDSGVRDGDAAKDLRGFRPLAPDMVIDWRLFFPMLDATVTPQAARPIDPMLARPLAQLPFKIAEDKSDPGCQLAFRNLHRGEVDLGLPTGQEVARALRRRGVPLPQTLLGDAGMPIELSDTAAFLLSGVTRKDMNRRLGEGTPLWYYVLKEAEVLGGGIRLGPVGGRLVAETLLALLLSDPLGIENTGWRPTPNEFGCTPEGRFGIAELLHFASAG